MAVGLWADKAFVASVDKVPVVDKAVDMVGAGHTEQVLVVKDLGNAAEKVPVEDTAVGMVGAGHIVEVLKAVVAVGKVLVGIAVGMVVADHIVQVLVVEDPAGLDDHSKMKDASCVQYRAKVS